MYEIMLQIKSELWYSVWHHFSLTKVGYSLEQCEHHFLYHNNNYYYYIVAIITTIVQYC